MGGATGGRICGSEAVDDDGGGGTASGASETVIYCCCSSSFDSSGGFGGSKTAMCIGDNSCFIGDYLVKLGTILLGEKRYEGDEN
ncbi:Hypothetical predicted protein [Octopus vulgaris]|uniref:Uncharacterized protein n=1 Tax=Octopus vulgaris TaxID=6645 RepID=A0AA36F6T8_OCTVU|nr:Hypothetical predicted protein [Octopus vulgaris]